MGVLLEVSYMSVLHLDRLPRPELITKPVAQFLEELASFPEVSFILLFGSRAIGDAAERSDVDVSVSAPYVRTERWLEMKRLAEEAHTLLWITLVRFESSPKELQDRNLADGVIIYESKKINRQYCQP
jgi:predicted nucleotidyltransferase